jgi:MoaA/NifB/PqqE/SkfB family radical SAM enzyme
MQYNNVLNYFNKYYSFIPRKLNPSFSFLPRQFIFEITYRCNFRCPVCQFRPILKKKDERQLKELSFEQIISCLKKLPKFSLITLTGGEPFIREDIIDIITESTRLRKIHIITNGSFLEPEICNQLCKVGLKHLLLPGLVGVDISYYGNLENGKINTNTTTEGLENFLEAKKRTGQKFPFINFKIVITKENIPLIIPFYKYAVDKGVDVCSFLLMTSSSNFNRNDMIENLDDVGKMHLAPSIVLDYKEKDLLQKQLLEAEIISRNSRTQLRFSPSVSASRFYDLLIGKDSYENLYCYAPWTFAAITAYGDLFPCSNFKLGSLLDHSLKEMWYSKKMKEFRLLIKKDLLSNCKKCCYLQSC